MIPKDFLRLLMDNEGIVSTTQLGQRMGNMKYQVAASRILNGSTKEPRKSSLQPFADFFKISVDDFFTSDTSIKYVETKAKSNGITINQYDDVCGSMGSGLTLRDQPGQITEWIVTPEWANKNLPNNTGNQNLRIVTGFGDSMRGMFNSGDPLIVDIGVNSIDFDGVYFFRVDDEGFIKRLQRIPSKGVAVISENKSYETWHITQDMDIEVFGRVLKVWKSEGF